MGFFLLGAIGLVDPTSQQIRVELMVQCNRRDRHTRALACRNQLSFKLATVAATPPSSGRRFFFDSVHVSAYLLPDTILPSSLRQFKTG
jgi:hypothetical protein